MYMINVKGLFHRIFFYQYYDLSYFIYYKYFTSLTLFKCFNKILRAPYLIIVRVRDMNGTLRDVVRARGEIQMCFLAVRTTVAVLPTAVIGSVKDMTWRGNSYSIRIKPVCHSHGGWTLCLSHETNASPTPPTRTRFSSW